MKPGLALFAMVCLSCWGFSQQDRSVTHPLLNGKVPAGKRVVQMPPVDNALERQKEEVRVSETQDKMRYFGKELSVSIPFMEMADLWTTPAGDAVRRITIQSNNALSMNLILRQFHLAPGAQLYWVNGKNLSDYVGAYTTENNNDAQTLGTELLKTDVGILVLFEPKAVAGNSTLNVETVVHGFLDLEQAAKGLNTSGDCNVDVNCPAGAGWELQRNSVAMMVNGGGFCTGSLVHNTSGSVIPYFLTARHCGTNPASWVFRFRWEAPVGQTSCATTANSGNGPTTMNVNGGILRATNGTSDFLLVQLNSAPNPAWGIYYNGWDNTDLENVTASVGIHHPDGDIKKISRDYNPATKQTIAFNGFQNRTWRVADWDVGVTEPGSSGSPLFNSSRRVIGVLSGGSAACNGTDDNNLPDYYGRFGYAWSNGASAAERLKDWLDPQNTGATVLDGFDPAATNDSLDAALSGLQNLPYTNCSTNINPIVTVVNSGGNTLTSVQLGYGLNGNFSNAFNWIGNLPPFASVQIPISFTAPAGSHVFNVRVVGVNGQNDQDPSNDQVSQNFVVINPDFTARLRLELDCYASETSWHVTDSQSNILYQSEPYSDGNPDTVIVDMCLSYGCYTITMIDSYGDGFTGCSSNDGGNGMYILTNLSNNNSLAGISEANANFGTMNSQNFCVTNNVGLAENALGQTILLFPNPGSSILNIQTETSLIKNVSIYSMDGKEISMADYNEEQVQLNAQLWESGVYIIRVTTEHGTQSLKWTKK